MSFWKQSKLNNSHKDEVHQAELLDVYTRWLKGEKVSSKHRHLLETCQESSELEPLRRLVEFAHYQFQETDSVEPRPGAKERIADEIISTVNPRLSPSDPWPTNETGLQPAYSPEQVGSESELLYSPATGVAPLIPNTDHPFRESIVVEPENSQEKSSLSLSEANCHLRLKVIEGDPLGREYNIVFPQIIIGRSNDISIQLKQNAGASQKHALLSIQNDEIHITDLNSSDGTFVDGHRIAKATPLYDASQITIGDQVLETSNIRREEGAFHITFKEIVGEDAGQVYTVSVREMTIGRGKTARLRLPDSTGTLSRLHGQFELANGQIYIRDLGSTNGTYVDGDRIQKATIINTASVIKFGGITCEITRIEYS